MSSDAGATTRPFSDLINSVECRDAANYPVDGLAPEYAVRPRSVEELQEVVRATNAEGKAIIPWGGGSQMGFGNVPSAYHVAVDLTGLNEVLRYEPDDMTMSVQTGCRLLELNTLLSENRQVLPVDAPDPSRASIGGMIAVGASGPRRFGYGPLRDLIIGMTVLSPDGTPAKAGGQVVKNVTGYDMMRLHHGALGSLGIILSVNLKVIPKPQSERTVLAHYRTLDAADRAARIVVQSQLGVTALAVVNSRASAEIGVGTDSIWTVAARCEAPPSAVVRQAERVVDFIAQDAVETRIETETQKSQNLWVNICQALDQRAESDDIAVRFGCPASRLNSLTEAIFQLLGEFAEDVRVTLDFGSGLAYLRIGRERLPEPDVTRLCETMADLGDQVAMMTGPSWLKRQIDVFGRRPAGFAAIQNLKRSFDPNGILNPGRFIGHL
jgi:glycolate oxidase FAD binding subunit